VRVARTAAFAAIAVACGACAGAGGVTRADVGGGDAGHDSASPPPDASDAGIATEPDSSSSVDGPAESYACVTPGALDPTFGNGGFTDPIFIGRLASATTVVIEPGTARILIGGSSTTEDSHGGLNAGDFAVVRLLPNGRLDSTFGQGGSVTTAVPQYDCWLDDVALQSDGRIVGVGGANGPNGGAFGMVRYERDGTLDHTFGVGGLVFQQIGAGGHAQAVAIDSAGRIVVSGQASDGMSMTDPAYFVTLRYLDDGTLDPAFGTNGVVKTSFGTMVPGAYDLAYDVKIQPDGRIIVAGWTTPAVSQGAFGAVRYDTTGGIDPTFGTNGLATVSFGGAGTANGLALDGLGRLLLVGDVPMAAGAVLRLEPNGTLDPSFGTLGATRTDVPSFGTVLQKVVVSPNDEKIVAAGWVSGAAGQFFLVTRYDANGKPDTTFGTNGISISSPSATHDLGADIALQADARIVVVGTRVRSAPMTQDFLAARYCP
jgi:uncharacterized delta-60 repeat protein